MMLRRAVVGLVLAACGGGHDAPVDGGAPDAVDASPPDAPSFNAVEIPGLDLGHVVPIASVARSGDAALSVDTSGHWNLWDLATHAMIASGDGVAQLAGGIALDGNTVRDAATGNLRFTLDPANGWGLATDGSYVWTSTASELAVWSPTGTKLVAFAGAYELAHVFAGPGELDVATGASVERLTIATGATSSAPFSGTFVTWSDDGAHFLTSMGNAIRAYTTDGVQRAIGQLATTSQLTAQGDRVWTYDQGTLRVYAVDDLSAPLATLSAGPAVVPDGAHIASLTPAGVDLISLADPTTSTHVALPFAPTAYGDGLAGSAHGCVIDPSGGQLSYGAISARAGSATIAAFATWSGWILLMTPDGMIKAPKGAGEIPQLSTKLQLVDGAKTLIATDDLEDAQYHEDRSLRMFDVATGSLKAEVTYAWSDPELFLDFSASPDGAVIAQTVRHADGSFGYAFVDGTGAPLPSYGPAPTSIEMIPDVLFSSTDRTVVFAGAIYQDGSLSAAMPDHALAFLDDTHILGDNGIYAPDGSKVGTATFPATHSLDMDVIDATHVFDRDDFLLIDITDGSWRGRFDAGDVPARAGDSIVFAEGRRFYAWTYH